MFLLLFAGNYKSLEIGCTETADVCMTFREIGHVMGAGYMPTEASKHARTHTRLTRLQEDGYAKHLCYVNHHLRKLGTTYAYFPESLLTRSPLTCVLYPQLLKRSPQLHFA